MALGGLLGFHAQLFVDCVEDLDTVWMTLTVLNPLHDGGKCDHEGPTLALGDMFVERLNKTRRKVFDFFHDFLRLCEWICHSIQYTKYSVLSSKLSNLSTSLQKIPLQSNSIFVSAPGWNYHELLSLLFHFIHKSLSTLDPDSLAYGIAPSFKSNPQAKLFACSDALMKNRPKADFISAPNWRWFEPYVRKLFELGISGWVSLLSIFEYFE